jgi:hypothetical protein
MKSYTLRPDIFTLNFNFTLSGGGADFVLSIGDNLSDELTHTAIKTHFTNDAGYEGEGGRGKKGILATGYVEGDER